MGGGVGLGQFLNGCTIYMYNSIWLIYLRDQIYGDPEIYNYKFKTITKT